MRKERPSDVGGQESWSWSLYDNGLCGWRMARSSALLVLRTYNLFIVNKSLHTSSRLHCLLHLPPKTGTQCRQSADSLLRNKELKSMCTNSIRSPLSVRVTFTSKSHWQGRSRSVRNSLIYRTKVMRSKCVCFKLGISTSDPLGSVKIHKK